MSFSSLSSRQRIAALVDPGSFTDLSGSVEPLPLVIGTARIRGQHALMAFSDGHVRGGTFGVHEAERISDLLDEAMLESAQSRPIVVVGFDTGGVRVEEGPRALAATSAAGIVLAQLGIAGIRSIALISGPRGCFGAPSVMASLPHRVVMTAGSYWGLTGPKLVESVREIQPESASPAAAAENRLANGDCDVIVEDSVAALRAELEHFVIQPEPPAQTAADVIHGSAQVTDELWQRLRSSGGYAPPQPRWSRRRGLLDYSLRGQWHPVGDVERAGMLLAGFGELSGRPALALVLGPEAGTGDGLGIEEAARVSALLARVIDRPGPRAMILNFLFCQGHAVDAAQERFGVHRALAQCLRAMVAARRAGHPIVTVLGGGTYGAAYFALAAPSHRILAMQGTSVAPMAPEVLRAFQELRGKSPEYHADAHLAERIPDVRIVESVIRLPRVLREELEALIADGCS